MSARNQHFSQYLYRMQYVRLLLYPFSLLYGIIIWLRNRMYDWKIFPSTEFDIPVISIGNLAVGGAGKSPMAEFLIRLLKDKYSLAVLSRGYKRTSKGFREVSIDDSVSYTGDEPLQFKRKFPDVTVAVSESRVKGIINLQDYFDLVILDDAFQHRAVKPGVSLLLFDFTRLNDFQILLPAGNLREHFSGRKRADIIIITKCPNSLNETEKQQLTQRINPYRNQILLFSSLEYGNLTDISSDTEKTLQSISPETSIFLLTGIANPDPLVKKLNTYSNLLTHHNYPDHHSFSRKNIAKLAEEFNDCKSADKIIVTTEKDMQRLQISSLKELLIDLPVYYLPIKVVMDRVDEEKLEDILTTYVTEHLQYN